MTVRQYVAPLETGTHQQGTGSLLPLLRSHRTIDGCCFLCAVRKDAVFMSEEHKTCKKTALRRIERISYLVHQLRDMKQDACPAFEHVHVISLDLLQNAVDIVRRELKGMYKKP